MALAREENLIKPFTPEQAMFIYMHKKNHPEQKISDFQEHIKKEFNLRKKPSIHQIQQCMKLGQKLFQYESVYPSIKKTQDSYKDSLLVLYGYK